MKILFVGDVHNHKYIFDDIKRLDTRYNFDRIIFIGDYVDDWNTTNHQSLESLDIIFKLKDENPDKYTFLIGNHELSYLGYKCSGHQYELEDIMELKLKEHIDYFDLVTSVNCDGNIYICSHAGFTNAFIEELLKSDEKYKNDTKFYDYNLYYKMVNMNKDKLNNLEPFSHCSYLRGGLDEFSSCLWCDIKEHSYFSMQVPLIPHQIVGHTPVKHIIENNGIYFIDTHSTYQDGTEYGDKSYLMWNENRFEVVK